MKIDNEFLNFIAQRRGDFSGNVENKRKMFGVLRSFQDLIGELSVACTSRKEFIESVESAVMLDRYTWYKEVSNRLA